MQKGYFVKTCDNCARPIEDESAKSFGDGAFLCDDCFAQISGSFAIDKHKQTNYNSSNLISQGCRKAEIIPFEPYASTNGRDD